MAGSWRLRHSHYRSALIICVHLSSSPRKNISQARFSTTNYVSDTFHSTCCLCSRGEWRVFEVEAGCCFLLPSMLIPCSYCISELGLIKASAAMPIDSTSHTAHSPTSPTTPQVFILHPSNFAHAIAKRLQDGCFGVAWTVPMQAPNAPISPTDPTLICMGKSSIRLHVLLFHRSSSKLKLLRVSVVPSS
jgi:hypothetical protein